MRQVRLSTDVLVGGLRHPTRLPFIQIVLHKCDLIFSFIKELNNIHLLIVILLDSTIKQFLIL
jgi:hypothetical protein